MKYKSLFIFIVILAFCTTLKGQISENSLQSQSAPLHGKHLKNIPDSIILLEILKIQILRIDNLNYMMDYLLEDQKRIEAKLDSVINILQKESKMGKKKRKKGPKKN